MVLRQPERCHDRQLRAGHRSGRGTYRRHGNVLERHRYAHDSGGSAVDCSGVARSQLIKRLFVIAGAFLAALSAVAAVMYATNTAPAVPAISTAEAANPTKPYVVKLHAKWCPVCMATKGVWSQIANTYSARVNLVVFDFTDQATTEAGRAEARRLGLQEFFDANTGWTGAIVVLDRRTKAERTAISGSRNFADYRDAIDAALTP